MAIPPTNSLLAALSSIGTDVRSRPAESVRAPAAPTPPSPARAQHAAPVQTAAPDPARPLPRGSLINIVV
jgi:hypothetical protein